MPEPWSEVVGQHGCKVRVFERGVGGNVQISAWDRRRGQNTSRSLRFKVRDADGTLNEDAVAEAKRAAATLSNKLIAGERPGAGIRREPTLGELIDLFRAEKLPHMKDSHGKDTARELVFWENYLGRRYKIANLGRREWDAATRERASGAVDGTGLRVTEQDDRRAVLERTVGKTLRTLRQVVRFGTEARRPDGSFVLDHDSTRGFPLPTPKNTRRPVADDETLARLLDVADQVAMSRDGTERSYLRELLILAAGTARRISAILQLRWSDWDPDASTYGEIRWRADSDKLGIEWRTPVGPEVREALEGLRQERPGVGEAWVFPAPRSDGHVSRWLARKWLTKAEELAGIEHVPGFGFHAFRRGWTTKRKHLPVQDVAAAGGWKDTTTLMKVYQQADPATIEQVVLEDRPLRLGASGG